MEDTIIKALLLGYAHIECNGTPIRICLKKAQGLLFYLLVHKKATRDELTGLLWGGEDNELARRHLRDNLYHLKKVVPIELVVPAGRSAIQLNPELGFYIDVDEFLKAVDVEAYQGEFLKGFSVPNCYEYEEWLERTRTSLREAYLQQLDKRAEFCLSEGKDGEAEALWRKYLQEEPLCETVSISLMRFYRAQKDYNRAALIYTSAPFTVPEKSGGSRTSDSEPLEGAEKSAPLQDPQDLHFKNREFCGFRTAESAAAEAQKVMPSKKEKRKIDCSQIEVSPSVLKPTHDGLTDEEREDDFLNILDACELTGFAPGTALVFENAIERLYYSDSYRIGNATLPQSRVRAKLRRLDGMILREAERKLHENQEQNVKNSTAYTMAVLFNCIAESESDLLVDPYLNALSSTA